MLAECARILLRRWRWVALAVVLALAAGAGGYKVVGPSQVSSAQVLFVPPSRTPGVTGATNPFLGLDNSLAVVASIVQVSATNDKAAQRLYQAGARAGYKIGPSPVQNSGPTLLVTVEAKSGAVVQRTLTAVLAQLKSTLHDLQAARNVSPDLYINAVVLTQSPHPAPSRKAQIQAAVLGLVAVAFMLIIAILLIERRTVRRRQAASAHRAHDESRREPQYPSHGRIPLEQPAIARPRRRLRRSSPVDGFGREALPSTSTDDDAPTRDLYASADSSNDARL